MPSNAKQKMIIIEDYTHHIGKLHAVVISNVNKTTNMLILEVFEKGGYAAWLQWVMHELNFLGRGVEYIFMGEGWV